MSASEIPKNNIKRGRAVIATLVATQVDIIFLTNYDQRQYHSPAFTDRLPSRFLRLWDCFSRPGASPAWRGLDFRSTRTGRLTLRGLFHQTMYITKFMAAHASVTISRWLTGKVSNGMCYALQYEPRCLEPDKGFTELVALPSGLDFCLGRHGKWLINITTHKIDSLQGM